VSNNGVNNGGGNIGYKFANGGPIKWELGGGGIANIADAIAMQNTGANLPAFPGFGFNSATEMLVHRVPGLNAHAELDIKQLSLLGEFVGATQQFAPANLTYDRAGAQPRAMHFEGDYSFNFIHFPTVFTLAYDHSWQALGLNLPQNSYTGDINISFWKDTIETIEYRHDTNYPSGTTAFSTNIAGYSPGGGFNNTTGAPLANNLVAFPTVSQGGSQNTVILQAGLYF
jgi:hypothetical protein